MATDFVTALSKKIDTEEEWNRVINLNTESPRATHKYQDLDGDMKTSPWWALREANRTKSGVYIVTEVLAQLNQYAPFAFVHVSTENPEQVSYTPDSEYGKRDRQVSMALGRLMVKLFPLFRDEYIQGKVAEHKAEMGLEIVYLKTPEDILEAYTKGPNSCMSHGVEYYPKTNGVPPVLAYGNVDGLDLAVLKDGNGKIVSRTLVRRDKKTYIRVYGDSKLLKALNREGYQPGSLQGLRMNTIPVDFSASLRAVRENYPLPHGYKRFVFPYLDANGSRGNSSVCSVALIDGVITVLTENMLNKANAKGISVGTGVNSSGAIDLNPLTADDFLSKDLFTGEWIEDDTVTNAVYFEGKFGETSKSADSLAAEGYVKAYNQSKNNKQVWAKEAETFTHDSGFYGRGRYIDTPATRQGLGYAKLDERFYPEATWQLLVKSSRHTTGVDKYLRVTSAQGDTNAGLILKEDGMYVVRKHEDKILEDGTVVEGAIYVEIRHKSEGFPAGSVKIHSRFRNIPEWADEGVKVEKTLNGRKVVRGHHNVVELYLGGLEFANKVDVKSRGIGDKTYWFVGAVPDDLRVGGKVFVEQWNKTMDAQADYFRAGDWEGPVYLGALMHFAYSHTNWGGYISVPNRWTESASYFQYPFERVTRHFAEPDALGQAVRLIEEKVLEHIRTRNTGTYEVVKAWVDQHRYDEAEAEAIDYTDQHQAEDFFNAQVKPLGVTELSNPSRFKHRIAPITREQMVVDLEAEGLIVPAMAVPQNVEEVGYNLQEVIDQIREANAQIQARMGLPVDLNQLNRPWDAIPMPMQPAEVPYAPLPEVHAHIDEDVDNGNA